ncbi:MAG: hypothetical protein H5T45_06465 [Thermoplasmatales archaeon]|nr:hypothetical protein [Thermoplasmatales archaeon]
MDELRYLEPWEEAHGKLEEIKETEKGLILCMSFGNVCIKDKSLIEKLKELKGKKIAILRTDIEGKEYLVRVAEEK